MNNKNLNQKNSFLVLSEETYPIMEKIDELVEKLKKIEEYRGQFTGTFQRLGTKNGWHGKEMKTILLTQIQDHKGHFVTDHLWFNYKKGFQKLGTLKPGDTIQFHARVKPYLKGYAKNYGEQKIDYKLSHPTKITKTKGDQKYENIIKKHPNRDKPLPMQTHTKPTNQINYYGPHNPQNTLNGYPRTLIQALTNPEFKQKEQCTLITQERLTHPLHTKQTTKQNLKNITQDTITLTKTLKKEQHPQKQKIIHNIIQTLTQLTKTLITKQKTLTNTPT